ncbi:hypothetical protein BKA93DRAFT_736902 [Sparassis latifolia]
MSRIAITNYFVNTNVTALQAPELELLFERIGEDAMFHLLTETSVFVSLPNECLCQLIGDPIIHMKTPKLPPIVSGVVKDDMGVRAYADIPCERVPKRKPTELHPDSRPLKRLKSLASLGSFSSTTPTTEHKTRTPPQK